LHALLKLKPTFNQKDIKYDVITSSNDSDVKIVTASVQVDNKMFKVKSMNNKIAKFKLFKKIVKFYNPNALFIGN
jgi:hypothetical protein